MEKMQTPVVAGVSGAAILAALLSFGGGGDAKKPAAAPTSSMTKPASGDAAEKGTAPNQEGPWRAVCEEYAPNGVYRAAPMETHRGYVELPTDIPDGTVEYTTRQDANGRTHKIAVHKQLVGDLVYCIPKPQLSGIHLIIATLPDPDKTEMRLEFDRYVDALEKAAAKQGFDFTGYWFPWTSQQTGAAAHKEDELEAALLRAEQPGILLFHNNRGERLFIFVVGETATSGIDRMQMVQALRYREALIAASKIDATYDATDVPPPSRGLAGARLNGPLMISGPHFSGSLSSLGEVLYESGLLRPTAADTVKVISPDAGSRALIDTFNTKYCKAGSGCSFRSLSITSAEEDWAVAGYLGRLGYRKEQIAELVEDESGFGINEREVGANESSPIPDTKPRRPEEEPFGLVLSFPRELSAVRSLSDQQSEQLAESGAKLLSFSKSPVDIKLAGDDPLERDRPSTYASDSEASEISNALANDVRVLRGNNIECIVVAATNPLDRIFLLEYIHDQLPNVRAVAQEADELEISHPHYVDLTGTIVVSSLPTVPELAAVRGTKPSSISFASAAAEEQFLSTATLLDDSLMERDITRVKDEAQDANVNGSLREDGWRVSIAGENGFELVPPDRKSRKIGDLTTPMLVFGKEQEKDGHKIDEGVALEVAESGNTPRFFISFCAAIFVLTGLHLYLLWASNARSVWRERLLKTPYLLRLWKADVRGSWKEGFPTALNPLMLWKRSVRTRWGKMLPLLKLWNPASRNALREILRRPAESKDPEADRVRKFAYVEPGSFDCAFNVMALNEQIFLLNCLVLAVNPAVHPFGAGPLGLRCLAGFAWVMLACMLPTLVVSQADYAWHVAGSLLEERQNVSASAKFSLVFFSFLMFTYLTSSVAFLWNWRSDAIDEWRRILTLNDGLSPIVPIAAILFAWALWATLQLRRVKFIAHRKVSLPFVVRLPEAKKTVTDFVCEDMTRIHQEIEQPSMGLWMVLFVLLFVGLVASWQWSTLRGIEPYSPWGRDQRNVLALFGHIFLPPSFEWWFGIWGGVMLLMTVLQTAYRLYQIWNNLARLLLRLEPTRMKAAFEKLGKDDRVHIKVWDLGKADFRFDEMALIIESLFRMGYPVQARKAQEAMEDYQNADLAARQPTERDRDQLNDALNVCVDEALVQLQDRPLEKHLDTEPKGFRKMLRTALRMDADPHFEPVEELDRYLALRFVTLIRYVLLQMRNFMWFVIYGYFLAVVSVTFYPFQGGKNLSDMLGIIFVLLLVIMAVLVMGVLRNPMLKRLEDTETNMASILQATFHMLSVGGLPALALLGWQFPWIGQLAFSWMRPLLSAFR